MLPLYGWRVHSLQRNSSYFILSNLYVVSNFDISLLPIKFNLSMVSKPLDGGSVKPPGDYLPKSLSDLARGYLSSTKGDIYDHFRLLSSGDIKNFYMDIECDLSYEGLCRVLNKLQSRPFQIIIGWRILRIIGKTLCKMVYSCQVF